MEGTFDTQSQSNYKTSFEPIKQQVPNATAVLVLGIASIPFACCYGFLGLILSIIALVLSGQARRAYDAQPNLYLESSYKNLNAGRICAIIGLSLSALMILFFILYILFFAAMFAGSLGAIPGLGHSL